VSAAAGATVTLRAWHLPGLASGKVVFSTGPSRLCVAAVRSGGGSCAFDLHLVVGVHVVVAKYLGDRNFGASLGRTSLDVLPPTASRSR
jgi:hypothetical protein